MRMEGVKTISVFFIKKKITWSTNAISLILSSNILRDTSYTSWQSAEIRSPHEQNLKQLQKKTNKTQFFHLQTTTNTHSFFNHLCSIEWAIIAQSNFFYVVFALCYTYITIYLEISCKQWTAQQKRITCNIKKPEEMKQLKLATLKHF